jgi:hypothetical protein
VFSGSSVNPQHGPAPTPLSGVCAGPSETLRFELTASLALGSSVHANDVELIETSFAITIAYKIEKILCAIERETFQHLQLLYPLFVASPEYAFLVAQIEAEESKNVRMYRSMNKFLSEVKERKIISFINGEDHDYGGMNVSDICMET